jgi:translation initiation factor IF-1
MDGASDEIVSGVIVEIDLLRGGRCRIRLNVDREIDSVIPRHIAQEMFRIVPGDRVRVSIGNTQSRVIGLDR